MIIPQWIISINKHVVYWIRLAKRNPRKTVIAVFLVFNFLLTSLIAYGYFMGLDRFYFIRFLPKTVTHAAYNTMLGVEKIGTDLSNLPYQLYGVEPSKLPEYDLTMSPKNLRQLNANLPAPDFNGVLGEEFKASQPGTLAADGKNYKVDVHYRGDLPIHWRGEKKSWRFKLKKGATLNGMTSINLLVPASRDFLMEYLDNYRAKKMGLAVPVDYFVRLKVNGQSYGIYYVIEQFSKDYLEKNGLSSDADAVIYGEQGGDSADLYTNPLRWQKYYTEPTSSANDLTKITNFLNFLNTASDAQITHDFFAYFDADNFYSWNIQSLLAGSVHQDAVHNIRLYFNPALGKFQALPWDVEFDKLSRSLTSDKLADYIDFNPIMKRVLSIPAFAAERNNRLWAYVNNEANLKDDLAAYDAAWQLTKRDFYLEPYRDDPRILPVSDRALTLLMKTNRQQIIDNFNGLKKLFEQNQPITGELHANSQQPNKIIIKTQVKNFSPVVLSGMSLKLSDAAPANRAHVYLDNNQNGVVDGSDMLLGTLLSDASSTLVSETPWSLNLLTARRAEPISGYADGRTSESVLTDTPYQFIVMLDKSEPVNPQKLSVTVTAKNMYTNQVIPANFTFIDDNFFARTAEFGLSKQEFLARYPMFYSDAQGAVVLSGVQQINTTIIIPRGLTVKILPGTAIYLAKNVSIISASPVASIGTATAPITVTAVNPNEPWGNFVVLEAPTESQFIYNNFSHGGTTLLGGLTVSGMLALHHSPVWIDHSSFRFAMGDDGVNLKYTTIKVTNSIFEKNSMDGLDLDISTGIIDGNQFLHNGNDGIDLSWSPVMISNNTIIGSVDKCISVGEHSNPTIMNDQLLHCNIGVASKDASHATISKTTIYGNKIGISLYIKKSFFTAPSASVDNSIIWGNDKTTDVQAGDQLLITHSVVQGGYAGEGNTAVDPKLNL